MTTAFANPFAAAQTTTPKETKKKGKGEIIEVTDDLISESIDEFVEASKKEKEAKADKKVASGVVLPTALEKFIGQFCTEGRQPETMKFRSKEGNQITLVVQDRGELYGVSDEQYDTLVSVIGENSTNKIVLETTVFKFNPQIVAKEGVMDVLGPAIGEALQKLVNDGAITDEEAGGLLTADSLRTIRKGTVADLSKVAGGDEDTMSNLIDALGSHVTTYVKS